jgi:hypothetical protein
MNNFELIEDYLTNRLAGTEKAAFEKQIDLDPTLKADVEFQRTVIEGVKKARAAELKAMLQKVAVGGASSSLNLPIMKMAAGVIGAGLLVAVLTQYFKGSNDHSPSLSTSLEDSIKKSAPDDFKPAEEPVVKKNDSEKEKNPQSAEQKKNRDTDLKKKTTPAVQPKIEVIDPTGDMIEEENNKVSINNEPSNTSISTSRINVDVISSKQHTFHYQFAEGKLLLYGTFDKSLYEILEINGDEHTVFMFYKDRYYLLDEKQTNITSLQPIKDELLINKLKEYRGR